jgi:MFS family permease
VADAPDASRRGAATDQREQLPASWRDARRLLRGPLLPLAAGRWFGQGADGLVQIAYAQVILFEVGRGATPLEITQLLVVTLLPFSVIGPFAGVFVDRWDRRRILIIVSLVRVALVTIGLAALASESRALAYVGVFSVLSASRFVLTAKGAALPHTVDRQDLVAANGISSIGGMVAAFAGVVGGSLFVADVPAAGFVVAAGLYTLSVITFRRLPPVGGGEVTSSVRGELERVARELVDGVRLAGTDVAIRRPLAAVTAHRFLLGAGFILLVLIADYRYEFEADGYGLAVGVTGVGAFIGTSMSPVLAKRFGPVRVMPFTFLASGAVAAIAVFAQQLAALIAGVALVAVAFQVLKIIVDALVQGATPDVLRGRVVSIYDMLYNVAFIVAGLALVPLWAEGREQVLLAALAAGFFVVGLVVAVRMESGGAGSEGMEPGRGGAS